MRVLASFFILVSFITYCDSFCNPDSKNIEVKLKNDILCNYRSDERPNQLNLPVELNYGVRSFTYDEYHSILTIEARILHRWEDLRLRWDENSYAGIQIIHVNSDKIWIPRLFINDSLHHYGIGDCHPTECILKSNGQVGCWIPCIQKLDCDADYSKWPFDSHICKVAFKTFFTYEDVKFDTDNLAGQVIMNMNNEWKISSMTGFIDPKKLIAVKFSIKIERYSGTIYKHVIVPIYCLMIFSLVILWIKSTSIWRLIFCGINVLLHFQLMDRVWWQFPSNGASRNVPNILKSMIFMLILSTLILIESIMMKVMTVRCSNPPNFMHNIVSTFEGNSIIKYATLSANDFKTMKSDENETNEGSDKTVVESFVRIIDRVLFIILSVVFLLYKIV